MQVRGSQSKSTKNNKKLILTKPQTPQFARTLLIQTHHKSKSSSPRLKPRPDEIPPLSVPDSNPRKSNHFTREMTVDPHTKHERKTIRWSKKNERVEEKSGRYVSSCSLSSSTSTSNATTCSSPPRHRLRRPSPELRFNGVLTPDPADKTTSSSSSSTLRSLFDPDITAVDVTVGMVNPLGLSPISTKNKKKVVKHAVTEQRHGLSKRFSLSTGMRIRVHSPRLLAAARGMQARRGAAGPRRSGETNGKRGGFAVVKSSFGPWRDFRDSMLEMIVENRIKESEGLEDLLVCYLSLNSEVYHDVIIAAFKQVWFDLMDIRLNENSC